MYREEIPYTELPGALESSRELRYAYWETGKALQACDELVVSDYAQELASSYIAGDVSAAAVVEQAEKRYRVSTSPALHPASSSRQVEADIVALRIVRMLDSASGFALCPAQLKTIHRELFEGVLDESWVGVFRSVNLSKPEPALGGENVVYADWHNVCDTLDYDFDRERAQRYRSPLDGEQVALFTRFIANIWQVHPFREGNTRTIAVFTELYLRKLGLPVDNTPFMENSVYFRDALVRANYADYSRNVDEEPLFLRCFFENVILDARHDLSSLDVQLRDGHMRDN